MTIDADVDPVSWMLANFHIPETGGPLTLEPYQRAALSEALRRENGQFAYSVIIWSDIKKSAKSTIAAAVALWRAWMTPWGSVRIVANDLKQADSRVSFYLRRALELNPAWQEKRDWSKRGYSVTLGNHAQIEAVPVDPKGEAGGGDDVVVFSELWAAQHDAAQRMWTETTLSPLKFGKSFRWVETYAGFTGESPLLEQLYDQGVTQGRRLDLGFDGLEVYANDAARMFCLWNTRPLCPWQTNEYYAQEAAVLTPDEFRRVHRNQWISSTNAFVPAAQWGACYEHLPKQDPREPMVLAMDAATSGDSFAVVGVTRHPDPAQRGRSIAVRYCGVWYPPLGGKVDYRLPEGEVRRLCREYNVVQVAYDPYQLEDMSARLMRDDVAWLFEFSQGARRLESDKLLYDLIMRKGIAHDGNPELKAHIENADSKIDAESRKLRIVKRNEHLKIDAAVALSMAAYECLRLNL